MKAAKQGGYVAAEPPVRAAIEGLKAQINADKPPELSLHHFRKKKQEYAEKVRVLDEELADIRVRATKARQDRIKRKQWPHNRRADVLIQRE
eukprot:10845583-Alexandrium_andersonii.AAC.1